LGLKPPVLGRVTSCEFMRFPRCTAIKIKRCGAVLGVYR
jgi:hypothetical protein